MSRLIKNLKRGAVALVVGTFVAGCVDEGTTTAPAIRHEIIDAAHGVGGNQHFYFLAPLVATPSYSGVFDSAAAPTVVVCISVAGSCGDVIAQFDGSSGTGGANVVRDNSAQHFIVNWDTKQCVWGACTLDPSKTYRIRVSAGGVELGHAEVIVAANGSQMKNVRTDDFITLVNGRTLPIKFRIEVGWMPPLPPPNEDLVFSSDRDGNREIYAINADGTGLRNVTHTATWESELVASPDGTRIAFLCDLAGAAALCTINTNGTAERVVASDIHTDYRYSWSPDSRRLVFTAFDGTHFNIAFVNSDGTNRVTLTSVEGLDPVWSPDGQHIAYWWSQGAYVMKVDGTGVVNAAYGGQHPSWSPDGTKIAYLGGSEIYVMSANGSNQTQVSSGLYPIQVWNQYPISWSPDSKKVVFSGYGPQSRDVFVANADGTGQTNLTNDAFDCAGGRWSLDGRFITYMDFRGGDGELWVMNADGSGKRNISQYPGVFDGSGWWLR